MSSCYSSQKLEDNENSWLGVKSILIKLCTRNLEMIDSNKKKKLCLQNMFCLPIRVFCLHFRKI